ncbi:MAG: TetR/AcrR family transcriptional regulator, partial [Peptococcaceae bacterium]
MSKHQEKNAQTKAALVEAFWQLYKTKPISKITVKDVTDRAGFYRSTLYNYFEDVYAILEYIETAILQEWEQVVAEGLTPDRQQLLIQGRVEDFLPLIAPFYQKNGETIAVLLSPAGDPLFQQK